MLFFLIADPLRPATPALRLATFSVILFVNPLLQPGLIAIDAAAITG